MPPEETKPPMPPIDVSIIHPLSIGNIAYRAQVI